MALIEHKRLISKFNLDCFVPNWREDGTVDKICKRYGCKIHGKNEGLQASHGSQLIQAILAIYAWIEFTEQTIINY